MTSAGRVVADDVAALPLEAAVTAGAAFNSKVPGCEVAARPKWFHRKLIQRVPTKYKRYKIKVCEKLSLFLKKDRKAIHSISP